jgi:hypothetical protein
MGKKLQKSELLQQTIELVRNRPRTVTYTTISEATGLPVQFLQDLMADRLKDPGVTRIEILYNYFAKNKLILAA